MSSPDLASITTDSSIASHQPLSVRVFKDKTSLHTLSGCHTQELPVAVMVRRNVSSMVHAMISNLKEQEIEIEEVTETIYENINKYRADLRFSLPELKRVLDDLLHE